ncbi:MAG TPA: enoyl-CoA hydratase-related protein [Ktedonobacterales bacterium]|jgi:enoyl-CoA hydratase|nr:enoyl-CoA hydratase-related protein [Ktedonobacterales bacterium]
MPEQQQYIVVERDEPIAVVTINRPDKLNALNWGLVAELADQLEALDRDDAIRCIVLTGAGNKAFAAGADIAEMSNATPVQMATGSFQSWDRIRRIATPIIAAVGGYALGGGNELAMHADMIVASENAQFGQPEILIGVMPGAGGTQRLARTLGKFRAMEICLTARRVSAQEALDWGLVNRVVPEGQHVEEAKRLAQEVAKQAPVAVRFIKEAVLAAYETPLQDGLAYEKRLFALLFATEDQKEGMRAFLAKEKPTFQGR